MHGVTRCCYHLNVAGARAEMQERNRAAVLAAARAEFVERGFRDAKVDVIAARAGLTRGAVYSNFPGKRALYFAVLAADAAARERFGGDAGSPFAADAAAGGRLGGDAGSPFAADAAARERFGGDARTPREALAAFARSWLGDLPLATDVGPSRLAAELLPVVLADERTRRPFAQLTGLTALLVGLALERLLAERTFRPRMVRVAEAALTLLHGAGQLAAAAPGFVDEMVVVDACAQLADADFADRWAPPHLPYVAPARPVDLPFHLADGAQAPAAADGVLVVLGLHRLTALEEAVRSAPRGVPVTAAVVTGEPAELGPLARLVLADTGRHLAVAFPPGARPAVRIILDEAGVLAAAAGVTAVSDATETAVRIRGGRIVARADGPGAPHAAASFA
jgi:AcrR family transcriptional regulator